MTLLAEKLELLPTSPGVYQHKDAEGKVLYVGKAKNLRHRVRSYFQESPPKEGRLKILVEKIHDIEVIVTDTEAEALILENNLIKKLKPRYNINLKDDKTYPYICIKNEPFPRIFPTRRVRKDGSKYFGPYTDGTNLKRALHAIRSLFPLRTCTLNLSPEPIAAGKYQPCLQFHIKKCEAPCVGYQTEAEYQETIQQIEKLLNGHTQALTAMLTESMQEASRSLRFEKAAKIRDQITAIQQYAERQKIISQDFIDRDVFALALDREEDVAVGVLFKIREGKVIGRQHQYLRRIADRDEPDLMQTWLESYYTEAAFFPEEVYLSTDTASPEPLEEFLRDHRGKKVVLKVPIRGEKADLMKMAEANAKLLLEEWKLEKIKRGEERIPYALKALQDILRLPRLPRRIECFDISHLGGTGTVASCVVFEDGKPKKSEYRTYKLRGGEEGKPDDFLSMREVIQRRFRHIQENNGPWPDLVVIDGGKGQLSSAVTSLKAEGVYGKFPVIGLAKRLEEIFFPGDEDPTHISKTSAALQLLQRTRDEAHRFAVAFQRKQRQKRLLHSELLDIPGIGAKTVQKLIKSLGSVKRIRAASQETLTEIAGPSAAQKLLHYFESQPQ